MAGFVGLVAIAVVAAALLAGGESGSTTDPDAPTSPGTSPPTSEDRSEAEDATRETVEAYAAAEGEQETCRLLTADYAGSSCDTEFEKAQPAVYEIGRVELADDQATVNAKQAEFDDPIEFELLRQGDRWLINEITSFGWKDADNVEGAAAAQRFGRREGDYCSLLSRELLRGVGGEAGCEQRYPADRPVQYDVTDVYSFSYGTGSLSAEVSATESDSLSFQEEAGEWKISSID